MKNLSKALIFIPMLGLLLVVGIISKPHFSAAAEKCTPVGTNARISDYGDGTCQLKTSTCNSDGSTSTWTSPMGTMSHGSCNYSIGINGGGTSGVTSTNTTFIAVQKYLVSVFPDLAPKSAGGSAQ